MRIIRSVKIAALSFKLYVLQRERAKLRAKLKRIKAEEDGIVQQIMARMPESFWFNDPNGSIMRLQITRRKRMDMDDDEVRRFYAAVGRLVPLKPVRWLEVRAFYVED